MKVKIFYLDQVKAVVVVDRLCGRVCPIHTVEGETFRLRIWLEEGWLFCDEFSNDIFAFDSTYFDDQTFELKWSMNTSFGLFIEQTYAGPSVCTTFWRYHSFKN